MTRVDTNTSSIGRANTIAVRVAVLIATIAIAQGLAFAQAPADPRRQNRGGRGSATRFAVEEATITELHQAIRQGRTTCRAVVQAYVDRARAYNGVCTQLVTANGAADRRRRAAPCAPDARSTFPTDHHGRCRACFRISTRYVGLPIEFGRMEATRSDPTVQQQYGMVVGHPERRPGQRARARSTCAASVP